MISNLLNNPLLALSAGLLDPRGTYGSFGASLAKGVGAGMQAEMARQRSEEHKLNQEKNQLALEMLQQRAEDRANFQKGLQRVKQPSWTGAGLTAGNYQPSSLLERDPQKAVMSLLGDINAPEDMNAFAGLLNALTPSSSSMPEYMRLQEALKGAETPEEVADIRARMHKLTYIDPNTGSRGANWRMPLDDGTVAIMSPDGNFIDYARDANGDVMNTWASEKEDRIQDRSDRAAGFTEKRIDQTQQRINQAQQRIEETQGQNLFSRTNALGDDYRQDAEGWNDLKSSLDRLDYALEGDPDALDTKLIQSYVSQIANPKIRAKAELDAFKTYGNLWDRFISNVSLFTSGTPNEAQLQMVRKLSKEVRSKILEPSMGELESYYLRRSTSANVDPKNVIKGYENPYLDMPELDLMNVNVDQLSPEQFRQYEDAVNARYK